jgi:hypothetical protein
MNKQSLFLYHIRYFPGFHFDSYTIRRNFSLMKLSFKFFCTVCIITSCSNIKPIKYLTDLEQANINGPVMKLITETYQVDSSSKNINLESLTIEIFNELGNTITDTTKNFFEKNEVVNFLDFNKNGSLSSLSTFTNGKLQSKMLLQYNDDKCIAINIFDSSNKLETFYGNISQTEYGLLSSLNSYDAKGKLIMSYENKYDSIYQVSAIAKDSNGIVASKVAIRLTDKKYPKNLDETTYSKGSVLRNYLSYRYEKWDSLGNWIEQRVYNEKGKNMQLIKRIFSFK